MHLCHTINEDYLTSLTSKLFKKVHSLQSHQKLVRDNNFKERHEIRIAITLMGEKNSPNTSCLQECSGQQACRKE